MIDQVTPQQIDQYQKDGFVIIRGFLNPDELATWRERVDTAVAGRGKRKILSTNTEAPDEGYYSRVFTQRVNLWTDNEPIKELMIDPRLGRMAAELAQVDGIRVWHDQALIKEPWGNPTSWHLDNPYWSFNSRAAISIWVALDNVDAQNGCLYFMPGSHQEADFHSIGIGEHFGGLFDEYPQWRERSPVSAPMKAGDCSFHCGLTAHSAGPNITPRRRRAMTCAYMPDGSTFNGKQNVLPPDYLATLKVGDVLDSNDLNPLLYKRT